VPTLAQLTASMDPLQAALLALPTLHGGKEVLQRAKQMLPRDTRIADALAQLAEMERHFSAQGIMVSIDLGELGGFNYESGIVFAAFAQGAADAVARGGRYDEIGKAFGRARPATGFSMDLKALLPLVADVSPRGAILSPLQPDAAADKQIAKLRSQGEIVIRRLPGNDDHLHELGCDRELILKGGRWTVVPLAI